MTVKSKRLPWPTNPEQTKFVKDFKFQDFKTAWLFMNKVAIEAEKIDHHPNWSNSYNMVHIELTTHDEGMITEKDINLANQIDYIEDNIRSEKK
ncbi:MAG: 4a-hydroxytetrahydrobiopterin dehydratase [Rhizobiales bacterium]|nr:pterin-4-alpha-carbinolamine dehydratase [Rhodobiaceae bacterium]MBL6623496.1 4a-hydroxytetrahydrobiopterin dehydratase [Hyphomicrobiales bacterium]MBL6770181.1 4a-hydroxytetrahydrobiopterin dehydratase [Hyphomicrobiales bacterium]RPF97391.1 MAG: pterin-4-alpha-carbinolamine dehydratase [Rhizobiales bacterium TMED227]|tara:strand:+ start:22 stop:303 length:282 start_codon:yes stop_codon:yes gene_type:complete